MQYTDEDIIKVHQVIHNKYIFSDYFIKSLNELIEFMKTNKNKPLIQDMVLLHYYSLGIAECVKFIVETSNNSILLSYNINPNFKKIVKDYGPLLRAARTLKI